MATEYNADVAIIGGGGAGLVAAVAAAEKGADVIVLEKRMATGGNAVFASGVFVIDNRDKTSSEADALGDEIFRKAMSYAHWKINPRLIRALLEKSGDTISWLEDKGLKFEMRSFFPGGPALPFLIGPEKKTGAAVTKAMSRKCAELGVRVLIGTGAKKLLTDKGGNLTGVLAEAEDGDVKIKAKSVVIATGGFAGNKKLIQRYFPAYEEELYIKGLALQGDGTLMAEKIGSAVSDAAVLEMDGPDFPWSRHFFPRITMNRRTILVNRNGRRFTCESEPNMFEIANSLYRQPGKFCYTLFDESIKKSIFSEGLGPRGGQAGGDTSWGESVDNDLNLHAGKGRIRTAGSWEEIAEFMEISTDTLNDTINEYNSSCDQGRDPVFAKDPESLLPLRTPPYYAVRCCLSLLVTHGGIKINHRTEVIDKEDKPIPGLYAAGVEAGDKEFGTYNSSLPGHSFGFTVHSGRIAGEQAAGFAKGAV